MIEKVINFSNGSWSGIVICNKKEDLELSVTFSDPVQSYLTALSQFGGWKGSRSRLTWTQYEHHRFCSLEQVVKATSSTEGLVICTH